MFPNLGKVNYWINMKKVINIKCSRCGKITSHSLVSEGYSCNICGNIDKKAPKLKEVVFTPSFDVSQE